MAALWGEALVGNLLETQFTTQALTAPVVSIVQR